MRRLRPRASACRCSAEGIRGAAATEFLIVFPALVFLVFGIIQWGLIYQARLALDHATLLAARAGAVESGNAAAMKKGLAAGLAPLFASGASMSAYTAARTKAFEEISLFGLAKIEILNPAKAALTDFGQAKLDGTSGRELPNDALSYRNPSPGSSSGERRRGRPGACSTAGFRDATGGRRRQRVPGFTGRSGTS